MPCHFRRRDIRRRLLLGHSAVAAAKISERKHLLGVVMSRVGGMLEALQSVANFRKTDVEGETVSRGAVEIDRFDIDDPLDRRRRYERGQVAVGKAGRDDSAGRSHESEETDEEGRSGAGGKNSESSRKRDKERARAGKAERRAERRAERKRAKQEKREKSRREVTDEDEELAEKERGRDSRRRRKHSERKERSKGRSRHRPSSSSENEEVSSSEDDQAEGKRKRDKRRRKRQGGKKEKLRRTSRRQPSSSSESEEDSAVEASAAPAESPEAVANAIVQKFSKVTDDLKLLLQTVDRRQAVDVSGLPNKSLASFLERLFVSLHLTKLREGVYTLPEGSRPTLETLASFFENQHEGIDAGEVQRAATHEDIGPTVPGPVGPAEVRRRVIGPAIPSSDLLAAAAKLTEAQAALREAEEELFRDPLVGPAPAAAVAEAESANEAERFEEVTRMMSKDVGDAYDVLGLKPDALPNNIKKRYWKLSLLVHPDKCTHPQAHEAFMKLNKSFKDLQDPVKRAEIDRQAKLKLEKEEYEAEVRSRREAAQWRRLRGESPLSDDEQLLNQGRKEPTRDSWMTALPPERQAGHTYTQTTAFSRAEKSGRGDTSGWTDTPLQKAEKAKMQYIEAYKQAKIAADEGTAEKQRVEAAETAKLVDSYNQKKRAVPLVKKHKSKSAAKARAESSKGTPKSWAENHPWKPWDRDKDLSAGRQAVKLDPEVRAQGLQSRFGSSGTTRSFL